MNPGYDAPKELGSEKRRGAGTTCPARLLDWNRDLRFLQLYSTSYQVTGTPGRGHFTVIMSLILPNSPSLIPLTFMTSSMVLNGRPSMIA